jgi:cytochrome c oxidase subunit II
MTRLRWAWARAAATTLLVAGLAGGVRLPAAGAASAVKEVTVIAERFKFTPDRIEVNRGDTVRITIRSADGSHGFAIKRLKVDTFVPKGGQPVTVEFVAGQEGSFPITCSEYCGRGHSQMKGVLDVAGPGQAERR